MSSFVGESIRGAERGCRARAFTIAVGLTAALLSGFGCKDPPRALPPAAQEWNSPAPLRRLTQAELNRTVRDLFPGITMPAVALSDGQPPPGSGAKMDGDVTRQTPSDLVIEQLLSAVSAISAAAVASPGFPYSQPPSADVEEQRAVGGQLVDDFGPRALRRPFESGERDRYVALFDDVLAQEGFVVAVRATLQAFLQAPSFVYRVELGAGTPAGEMVPVRGYEMASRLSYFLWGTMPDAALFARAADGSLDNEQGLLDEASRMLDDPKARDGVLAFFRQWLDLDRILTTNKDADVFPASVYNEELKAAMREEADRFVLSVMFDDDARLETLLTSTRAPVNATLAALYGVPAPATDWDFVELPAAQRAGILTQAQFLAARAHAEHPSPVQRGIFVLDRLLCEPPPVPDGAIDTTPPPAEEGVRTTNRDRFAQHAFDPVCQGCHVAIDGVGFGFEGYDAIGRFRTVDNGLPVNDRGSLDGTAIGGTYHGAVELAQMLAGSDVVRRCVARHWFRNSLGRREVMQDAKNLEFVFGAFSAADGDMKSLLLAIVLSPSFRNRPALGGAP
jgi:Protein of unknown function (DUF1592)/Protein of unknown function (DUF1588)/Protein of unknown function (DUF1595)/Protein of unknown function (DUF1585)/Protein of unknown function (DUF1587)